MWTPWSRHIKSVIHNTFPPDRSMRIVPLATYAQKIKNKTAKTRKPAARSAAKARPAAPPKAEPATAPQREPAPAPPVASGELQQLKDDLQLVNQEISRLARVSRPGSDPARHSQLPEKQGLLIRRLDLERKIRALSKP